jgi:hypothetical protein
MKLHLMFLLIDILMLLACGFLWLKSAFKYAMHRFGITKP